MYYILKEPGFIKYLAKLVSERLYTGKKTHYIQFTYKIFDF